ncbi:flavin-containing monooxygenase [Solimonas marina]|uniref:NAD(P)/FAD-dependent oxidoreductase n=1 Tax=Solimonas marina TaxID=2714601 RepID=A0A969WCY3_9GAMM|nr:NAD(P)/FAD-dependent oxidoreductase [Solimonas marina]NKF24268.1 NAD(P)/FAD-dependent oxidoreductase [Solimonas marina]
MAFDANYKGGEPVKSVLIIGSGFSGLGLAVRLKQAGIEDFEILERADSVGGTWRDNRYPGCACDVQSHLYSFSFEQNPGWTRMFARQPEIERYLQGVADKYQLVANTRFGANIVDARWDEAAAVWRVRSEDGRQFIGRVLVSGMGALSNPAYPKIPGLADFQGKMFHSAQWDHDYDLSGKRVAVIGTGASAIQFVPQVVPKVAHLDLFQRTPPWILPKPDREIGAFERKLFRLLPFTQKLMRAGLYTMLETRVLGFVIHPKLMEFVQRAAKGHIKRQVKDPELRRKLTPNYTIGCKRVLISNDYYPSLTQPHVDVVTDDVTEIRGNAVITADGRAREVDAIILGTGFTVQDPIPRGAIFGRGGKDLWDTWSEKGVEAYLGATVHGFPNFFMLMGPNTGLGHTSQVYMIESQINYVVDCLKQMRRKKIAAVDVRADVQRQFNDKVQGDVGSAVWNSGGCKSWYLDARGRNTTIWPGFTFMFRNKTRHFRPADYQLETARATKARA